MSDRTRWIVVVVVFTVSMASGIGCQVSAWKECRAFGHSKSYCFYMVGK